MFACHSIRYLSINDRKQQDDEITEYVFTRIVSKKQKTLDK
jgi:hypothetical protein